MELSFISVCTEITEHSVQFVKALREGYLMREPSACSREPKRRPYFPFCSAIHFSVRASRRSSGKVPPFSISSWKLRRSNFGPSSFFCPFPKFPELELSEFVAESLSRPGYVAVGF